MDKSGFGHYHSPNHRSNSNLYSDSNPTTYTNTDASTGSNPHSDTYHTSPNSNSDAQAANADANPYTTSGMLGFVPSGFTMLFRLGLSVGRNFAKMH